MPKVLDDRLAGIDSDAPADSEQLARQQAVKQIEARRRFKISTAAARRRRDSPGAQHEECPARLAEADGCLIR
jgi:hypothetical protein